MTRFGRLATICIVLVFCAATALSSPAQTLSTLHSFGYNGDGAYPYAGLIQASDGSFYGTTWGGGAYGYGTVFRMSASGTVTTLQSFNFNNGAAPTAGLVQASDGSFYGTTEYGGTSGSCSNGCGTVFQITASGALITLHYFTGGGDGGYPVAGLVQASDGNFYGTTQQDGLDFGGTVFKITPSGTFTTLYNFCSQASCTDGAYPEGALIQASDGDFYGTTYYGGANCTPLGCGTIFKINSSGTLSTLHSFDSIDGEYPQAGLIQATDGNFYGTTWAGGATGHGTIFKCTPSGTLTTLHSFDGSDGSEPVAALLQATDGNFYGTTLGGGSSPNGTIFQSTSSGTLTTLYSFCSENNCADGANPNAALLQASDGNFYATTEGGGTIGNGTTFRLAMGLAPGPLQLIPLTPCRLADTRTQNGGGGPIQGGTYQTFNLPELAQSKDCADLFTAAAYSLNVTVVPQGPLSYLTIWPAGEAQPLVSTMNSLDGRIKANAAIVPAGASRAVSVYASDTTDVVLDIDGYFAPPGSSTLAFYPLTPCRVLDTRWTDGSLGGPYLKTNEERDFPVLESDCNVPSSAQAYSMNFTVVPYNNQPLGYLTVWPQGGTRPVVSTLNNLTATIVANAAIVPAGTDGGIATYPSGNTHLVADIDGYFAPAGTGGLSLYPTAPCRVIDTRKGNGQFSGELTVNVVGSTCAPPSNAQAYVFNATVVPVGALGYLTLWPDSENKPVVSTLNAVDGMITSNMAIVPNVNGSTDAYASGITQLVLDISSYFAP